MAASAIESGAVTGKDHGGVGIVVMDMANETSPRLFDGKDKEYKEVMITNY